MIINRMQVILFSRMKPCFFQNQVGHLVIYQKVFKFEVFLNYSFQFYQKSFYVSSQVSVFLKKLQKLESFIYKIQNSIIEKLFQFIEETKFKYKKKFEFHDNLLPETKYIYCLLKQRKSNNQQLISTLQQQQIFLSISCSAGQNHQNNTRQVMHNIKILNKQLQNSKKLTFLEFINDKSDKRASKTGSTQESFKTSKISNIKAPFQTYIFKIRGYQIINDHAEYIIQMSQTFKILGRTISIPITFKTRYSMLQRLNQKLQKYENSTAIFPPKKYFWNKTSQFLTQRKKKLQIYLNKISEQRSVQFLRFVKQIKENDFNQEMMKNFKLE